MWRRTKEQKGRFNNNFCIALEADYKLTKNLMKLCNTNCVCMGGLKKKKKKKSWPLAIPSSFTPLENTEL